MTVASLVPRVREALGVNSSYDEETIPAGIRRALKRLIRDYNFPQTLLRADIDAIDANQVVFDLPYGTKKIMGVWFFNPEDSSYSNEITRVEGFRRSPPDNAPSHYWRQGNQIITDAALGVSNALNLVVFFQSNDIAENEDWLSDEFDDVVFHLTVYQMAAEVRKPEVQQVFQALWAEDQRSLAIYLNELEYGGLEMLQREARGYGSCRYPSSGPGYVVGNSGGGGGGFSPGGSPGGGTVVAGPTNTDGLPEGATNRYFTAVRARAAISATAPVTFNASTGQIGLSATTDDILEPTSGTPARQYFNNTRARAAFMAGTGISLVGGVITATGSVSGGDAHEVWLDQYYVDSSTTDTQALLAFAAEIAAMPRDVKLRFKATTGRGPSGRFLVEQEIQFTGGSRIVLDFGESTIRYTTAGSKFRYTAPVITGSSSVTPTHFFVMKGGVHQYAAALDCIGFWDFPYMPSRDMGTGYVEDMRVIPQDNNNSAHTCLNTFKTKNTWYFHIRRCHVKGPPRTVGNLVANSALLKQLGLCVVTTISEVEGEFFDTAFIPGVAAMVGVEGTFAGGATYARGKTLVQGVNSASFGRNDSGYGVTYSLYDEIGTLANGVCNVLDSTGTITGTFTITSVSRYSQPSEALTVDGGSTFISCNYFANAAMPVNGNGNKWLEWTFNAMHMAYYQGFLKLDYIAVLQVGQVFLISQANGLTAFDINHGDNISIIGVMTSNAGTTGTFLKARNITAGNMIGNTLYFFTVPWDFDNTVKSFKVIGNGAYELGVSFAGVSTANRYNYTSDRGVLFHSNGKMGIGFDQNDIRRIPWTPAVSAQFGAIGAYSISDGYYSVCNGMLSFTCKIVVSNRGTAAGNMRIVAPQLPSNIGPVNIGFAFGVHATIGNQLAAAGYDTGTGLISVDQPYSSNTGNAFQIGNVDGNFVYLISATVPVQYN